MFWNLEGILGRKDTAALRSSSDATFWVESGLFVVPPIFIGLSGWGAARRLVYHPLRTPRRYHEEEKLLEYGVRSPAENWASGFTVLSVFGQSSGDLETRPASELATDLGGVLFGLPSFAKVQPSLDWAALLPPASHSALDQQPPGNAPRLLSP